MKHLFLILLFGAATVANAQTNKGNSSVQQSRTAETIAPDQPQEFANAEELAKGLSLSKEEAERVWLKYTEYKSAKKNLMEKKGKSMKRIKSGSEKMSDADYESAYRAGLEMQRERIKLDESYYNQFLEILPASKVHQLLMNERNNRKHLRDIEDKPEQTRTRIRESE
ncbi:hypothetical protein G3O08_11770 [Cryomorpha ignava]|uniref:DUF4168 domain-containing protein n=1 Tax=Cryomorpha ignava TaxID=101383 RepID=A0A7K3WR77_9FLAO|nr:hypothetical protein [Cryomorpha ignava]NEN24180.1 hypothetical protein [Cryomorpha ignava]